MSEFVTKDSGKRVEYPTGMRRDTQEGKPDYTLVDYDMLTRWAELMTRGAEKYGRNNWQLPLKRWIASKHLHSDT